MSTTPNYNLEKTVSHLIAVSADTPDLPAEDFINPGGKN